MPTSNNKLCIISGFLVYFFLMAAFSWMNITCFDIWKTFGSTRSKNAQRREQRTRFLWYSVYGWGLPTILTTITASLNAGLPMIQLGLRAYYFFLDLWEYCSS
ncbi:hypothetical protein ACLKA7_003420 [Drosophila subpalustris]